MLQTIVIQTTAIAKDSEDIYGNLQAVELYAGIGEAWVHITNLIITTQAKRGLCYWTEISTQQRRRHRELACMANLGRAMWCLFHKYNYRLTTKSQRDILNHL